MLNFLHMISSGVGSCAAQFKEATQKLRCSEAAWLCGCSCETESPFGFMALILFICCPSSLPSQIISLHALAVGAAINIDGTNERATSWPLGIINSWNATGEVTFLEMGTRDGSVDSLTGDANRNMDKERKDAWFHPTGEGRGMLGFLFKDWI